MDALKCDKCGAPITTGAMAIFCPAGKECEFWEPDIAEAIDSFRKDFTEPPERHA